MRPRRIAWHENSATRKDVELNSKDLALSP
jgi:hypothetical protein